MATASAAQAIWSLVCESVSKHDPVEFLARESQRVGNRSGGFFNLSDLGRSCGALFILHVLGGRYVRRSDPGRMAERNLARRLERVLGQQTNGGEQVRRSHSVQHRRRRTLEQELR